MATAATGTRSGAGSGMGTAASAGPLPGPQKMAVAVLAAILALALWSAPEDGEGGRTGLRIWVGHTTVEIMLASPLFDFALAIER